MTKKMLCGDEARSGDRKTAATRVFDAARELFYHRGVRAVGVDEIVSTAGVTKPSLYRAYASKDALVAACLTVSAEESVDALEAALAACPPDPESRLREVARHFARKIAAPDFRGCSLSNTAVEFPEPGHPGRTVLTTCKEALRTRLVDLARDLAVREPEQLADGLVLVFEGAMASHHIFGSQGPSAAMIATADVLIDSAMRAAA